MPSLFSPLFLVAALLLGAILVLALAVLGRLGAGSRTLPYRRVESLVSPGEMRFYLTLRQVVGAHYLIMAKHVDFVLVNPSTLAPVLVIELDDATHERADRRVRDAQVDRILGSAGLPILHVPVRKVYDAMTLGAELRTAALPTAEQAR